MKHENIKHSIASSKKIEGYKDKKILLLFMLILALLVFWLLLRPSKGMSLKALSVATVQEGSLQLKVSGVGQLKSKDKRIVTSKTSGVVEEIMFYPGEELKDGQVILSLSNPNMKKDFQSAQLELEQAKYNFKEFEFNQKVELIKFKSDLARLKSELEKVTLVIDAEKKLKDFGIISALDTEQKELDKHQLA